MVQGVPVPLFPDAEGLVKPGRNAALLAGIGNPRPLAAYLAERYDLKAEWLFRDHYVYKVRDLRRIADELASLPEDTVIVTTGKETLQPEKSACRIAAPPLPDTCRRCLHGR